MKRKIIEKILYVVIPQQMKYTQYSAKVARAIIQAVDLKNIIDWYCVFLRRSYFWCNGFSTTTQEQGNAVLPRISLYQKIAGRIY